MYIGWGEEALLSEILLGLSNQFGEMLAIVCVESDFNGVCM